MLVNEPAEWPEPSQDEASNEALLHEPEWHDCASPRAPSPQQAVLFCCLPGQVRHLKWWFTKISVDDLDIAYMYAEMGNDEHREMQLKFQLSPNPSVCVTTPKVGGTGLSLTAANHAVITQKFWVMNVQCQSFAQVVWLGQNIVPPTWLLTTGPSGDDNRECDHHHLSGAAQRRILYGLISRPNTTTLMIYSTLECRMDHMMQLMECGDIVPSDGEDECQLLGQFNRGTPL